MPSIGLRAATAADDEFCFLLHKATMAKYVAEIWSWDEQDQRERHVRTFASGFKRWQIITDATDPENQTPIGLLDVERGQPLTLDVFAINTRAHQLYQRLGFTEVERYDVLNGDSMEGRYGAPSQAAAGGDILRQ